MIPSRTHRVSFALVSRCLRLSPELPRGYPPSGTGIREADIQPFFTILLSYIKKNLIFAPASRGEILLKSRSAFNVKIANFNYRQAQTSCHRWVVCLCLYGCLAIPNVKWTAAHFFLFYDLSLRVAEEAKHYAIWETMKTSSTVTRWPAPQVLRPTPISGC